MVVVERTLATLFAVIGLRVPVVPCMAIVETPPPTAVQDVSQDLALTALLSLLLELALRLLLLRLAR